MRANTIALVVVLSAAAVFMFLAFPVRRVTLDVDGNLVEVAVRSEDSETAIQRAALTVGPKDRITTEGDIVRIDRARTVYVEADGAEVPVDTQASTVGDVIEEAGVEYSPEDTVLFDGHPVEPAQDIDEAPVPSTTDVASLGRFVPELEGETAPPPPVYLEIRRPQRITISVDGEDVRVRSSHVRVEELLAEAGVAVAPNDYVEPALDGLIGEEKHITVLRQKTVFVVVAGEITTVTSYRQTVGELLEDIVVDRRQSDIVTPGLGGLLEDQMTVSITKLRGESVIIDEAIPFETIYREDPDLGVGEVKVAQEGRPGLRHREFRLDTIDGDETERELIGEWVDPRPQNEIIALGTGAGTVETEGQGVVPYVDTLEVFATWYNATCEGCDEVTSTQTPLRYGVIAVDPKVIPLFTCLYVPGYGFGRAEDVGGAIKGDRIDLGFPGQADGSWWGARDVEIYILPSCPDELFP